MNQSLGQRLNRWLGHRKLSALLLMAIVPPLLLMVALGLMALSTSKQENERAQELAHRWVVGVKALGEARAALLVARDFEVKHSRTEDTSYFEEYEAKFKEASATVLASLKAYKALPTEANADHDKLITTAEKGLADYSRFSATVLKEGRAGAHQDAKDISDGAAATSFDDTTVAMDRLSQWNFEQAERAATEAEAAHTRGQRMILGTLVFAVLLSGLIGALIARALLSRLGGEPTEAVHLARAVADGDLSTDIPLRAGDDSSLMAALAQMPGGASAHHACAQHHHIAAGNRPVEREVFGHFCRAVDGAAGGGLDRRIAARMVGMPVGVPHLRDPPPLGRRSSQIGIGIGRIDAGGLAAGGIVQQVAVVVGQAGKLVDFKWNQLSLPRGWWAMSPVRSIQSALPCS